tara:strand:+ start:950 stop:1696 length:747 start_codon:yes stop_codon:yes gene_type:complete
MNQIKELDIKGYFILKLKEPKRLLKIENMVKLLIDNELMIANLNKSVLEESTASKYEFLMKNYTKGKSKIYNILKSYIDIDLLFSDKKILKSLDKILGANKYFKLFQACRLDYYPNNEHSLDWHQDAFKNASNINLRDSITVWIPINKSKNHSLYIIEGSHKGNHKQIVKKRKNKFSSESLELKLNLNNKYIYKNTKLIRIKKGEALVMSMALAHKSNITDEKELRITCLSRFISFNSKDFFRVSEEQ